MDGNGDQVADAGNSQSTELQTPPSDIRNLENQSTANAQSSTLVDEKKPKSKPSTGEAEYNNIELTEALNRNCLMNADSLLANPQYNFVPRLEFKGPNGSVTKMTLKNNQLIIETEERNDISRNARETKMHYNNSTGKDGVFVVEVSRGIDSQHMPESPLSESAATFIQTLSTTKPILFMEKNEKSPTMQEEVQVHEPPRDVVKTESQDEPKKLNQIPEVEEEQTEIQRSNTGLSQSDLSSSSSSNSNKAYTYGKQTLYAEDVPVIAKDNAELIKLQNETKPIKIEADDDPNKPSKTLSVVHSPSVQHQAADNSKESCGPLSTAADEMNVQSNVVEEKQKETNANEAIEMNNKSQMQVTTEPVVNAVVKQADVVETEHNLEINNANDIAIHTPVQVKEIVKDEKTLEKSLPRQSETIENNSSTAIKDENIEKEKNIEKCIKSNGIGIDVESVLDSLMSLPEPPSFEEIKQLNDTTVGDTNQLDSLPPPPPPPLFLAEQKNSIEINSQSNDALYVEHTAYDDEQNEQEVQQHTFIEIVPPPPTCMTSQMELSNGKQILSAQLTPPESPPGSNCANNRGTTGICLPLQAMAVNVNGS